MAARVFDCAVPLERERGLVAAETALRDGALVVVPTDTVYGLSADAFDRDAVAGLMVAKGGSAPPPVLVGAPDGMAGLAAEISDEAGALAEAFWPGGLTLVCLAQPMLGWGSEGAGTGEPAAVTTVSLRMPLHPVALELLARTGPLATSAANVVGSPPPGSVAEARDMLADAVAVYLDGGPCLDLPPSTIVDTTGARLRVVREGAVGQADMVDVVGQDAWEDRAAAAVAAGPEVAGVRAYLLVMAVAAIVTFLSTGLVRGLASRWGVVAHVRDRDVHVVPVPRLGGLAIFAGVAGGLGLAWTIPFLSGVFGQGLTGPLGILLAAAVICVVGVIDDVWGIDAWTKLAGQALAGVVMALVGVRLLVLPLQEQVFLPGSILVLLTVAVVLVAANAVNFVDGLDGLAAGMVAISATAFFAYSYQVSREGSPDDYSSTATVIAAVTVGACVGFLPHNLHPARIFMGDSGALTLGLLLAAATISVTGDTDPRVLEELGLGPAFLPLLLPAAALVIPVLDVVMAVVRRTLAGRSPFSPDRKHLHHRMLALGHSHRWAVALLHAWVALLSFGAAATAFWPWAMVAQVGAVAGALLLVLTVVPAVVGTVRRRLSRPPTAPPAADTAVDARLSAPSLLTTHPVPEGRATPVAVGARQPTRQEDP